MIPEFIAAMICESALDNLIVGNNAKNGSANPWLGISWCQLDTGYHVRDLGHLHALRNDPRVALGYVVSTPDLCDQSGEVTVFNKQRWHAWEPETINPAEGWNPLEAAFKAWDKVTA